MIQMLKLREELVKELFELSSRGDENARMTVDLLRNDLYELETEIDIIYTAYPELRWR